MDIRRRLRGTALLTLSLLTLALSACTTNVATGESFFAGLSRDQELALGAQAAPQFTQEFGGEVKNAALQAYVRDLGERMSKLTEGDFPGMPWTFTLLDSDVLNAFALPGGKVFISRGLAKRMTNEAQLAGVLGHEIGHVTAQHISRRIGQQQLFQLGLGLANVAASSAPAGSTAASGAQTILPALEVGGSLMLLKFGRDEESQADWLGLRYMSRAGYDPRGQLQVMMILRDASKGGASQPEWMSTHPLPQTRIDKIEELLRTDYASAQNGNFAEDRFRREFLAVLNSLPPPTHKAEVEVQALMELARAEGGTGDGCADCGGH